MGGVGVAGVGMGGVGVGGVGVGGVGVAGAAMAGVGVVLTLETQACQGWRAQDASAPSLACPATLPWLPPSEEEDCQRAGEQ